MWGCATSAYQARRCAKSQSFAGFVLLVIFYGFYHGNSLLGTSIRWSPDSLKTLLWVDQGILHVGPTKSLTNLVQGFPEQGCHVYSNPYDIPLYWLVNRDPYNGLLKSLLTGDNITFLGKYFLLFPINLHKSKFDCTVLNGWQFSWPFVGSWNS